MRSSSIGVAAAQCGHDPRTMGFDGLDADAQVGGDLLAGAAGTECGEDLALARWQRLDAVVAARSARTSCGADTCGLRKVRPAAAARKAISSSAGAASLTTKPLAPRASASRTWLGSSCIDIITTALAGWSRRNSTSASKPLRPGIDRSSRTMSGRCCCVPTTAWSALRPRPPLRCRRRIPASVAARRGPGCDRHISVHATTPSPTPCPRIPFTAVGAPYRR